jgi:hypothetical protein
LNDEPNRAPQVETCGARRSLREGPRAALEENSRWRAEFGARTLEDFMDNRRCLTILCLVFALGASTPAAIAGSGNGNGNGNIGDGNGNGNLGNGNGNGNVGNCNGNGDLGSFNGNFNYGSGWGNNLKGDYQDNFVRPPPGASAPQTGAAANCRGQDL